MTLDDAMRDACAAIGIVPPPAVPTPGRWKRTNTTERNGKGDASVLIFDDGQGGMAWNWQTQVRQPFRTRGEAPVKRQPRRDLDAERREAAERAEVEAICAQIVRTCRHEPHPYLARKGFPNEAGLVHDDPRLLMPDTRLGKALAAAMPEADGPVLVVPGRIGGKITTVQIITADGTKKNILRGKMGGAAHRIASGSRTVVCEGIATAHTVRAALRLLGASATVLSAFSASNVARVAQGLTGSLIAADNDKPIEALGGKGTGEFYAANSGCRWVMPPELGDFNDWHARDGLRAVALHLRGLVMG